MVKSPKVHVRLNNADEKVFEVKFPYVQSAELRAFARAMDISSEALIRELVTIGRSSRRFKAWQDEVIARNAAKASEDNQ